MIRMPDVGLAALVEVLFLAVTGTDSTKELRNNARDIFLHVMIL